MRFLGTTLILVSAIGLTGCIVEAPPRRPPAPPALDYGRPPPPPADYGRPPPPDYPAPPPRGY
jgi:hypothetical protein